MYEAIQRKLFYRNLITWNLIKYFKKIRNIPTEVKEVILLWFQVTLQKIRRESQKKWDKSYYI